MAFWILFGLLEVIGAACVVHLWRRRPPAAAGRRVVWTALCLVPLIGALAYGALYEPPSVQAEGDRARENPDARSGAGHIR